MVPGFPNLFMLNGPNGPIGSFSLIEIAERQMSYCMQLISGSADRCRAVAPSAEATEAFEDERRACAEHHLDVRLQQLVPDATGVPASWTFSYDRLLTK